MAVDTPESGVDRRAAQGSAAPSLEPLPVHSQASDVLAGRYRIDSVIAEGGMGTVYRGWHLSLDQPVAIKVLLPEHRSNREIAWRFLQEARVMASLRNRHVARVMDFGEAPDGSPYMVMELLHGQDVRQVLVKEGVQPIARAVTMVLQAAEATREAHSLGLVHRDLKPENLFIADDGAEPIVKVIDFGISKSLVQQGQVRTLSRDCLGSPQYMSPEQIHSSRSVDTRTDIWALGVILFELLTGKCPFWARTLPALCASVTRDEPQYPETLPLAVRHIISRCLAKQRQERFASMGELDEALRSFLRDLGCAPSLNYEPVPLAPSAELGVLASTERQPLANGQSLASPELGMAPGAIPASSRDAQEPAASESEPPPSRWRHRKGVGVAGGVAASLGLGAALFWPSFPALSLQQPASDRYDLGPEQGLDAPSSGVTTAVLPFELSTATAVRSIGSPKADAEDSPSARATTSETKPLTRANTPASARSSASALKAAAPSVSKPQDGPRSSVLAATAGEADASVPTKVSSTAELLADVSLPEAGVANDAGDLAEDMEARYALTYQPESDEHGLEPSEDEEVEPVAPQPDPPPPESPGEH